MMGSFIRKELTAPMWRIPSLESASLGAVVRCFITHISYHAHTMLLFTWSDFKTTFFPVTSFACSAAPLYGAPNLLRGCFWLWTHILLFNTSNQSRSKDEDTINRPWRPIPSGRVSVGGAVVLRWTVVFFCLSWSAFHHITLVLSTSLLLMAIFLYEELEWARHPVGKNFCNAVGYMAFEAGTTMMMGKYHSLDDISIMAVIISGLVILTTIQAQDFRDIEGDAATGRITLPMCAPEFSRAFTLLAVEFWSIVLCWIWNVPSPESILFVLLGSFVGGRYYRYRDVEMDKTSYLFYNFWLAVVHVLPIYARL